VLNEIRVGIINAIAGAVNPARADKSGALVVTQGHGTFQEAVDNGHVFAVANQTGVAMAAGLAAAIPPLWLHNPAGSEKKLAVWYVGVTFNVIFAAIAAVFVAVCSDVNAAAPTGTLTTTHRNMKIGASNDCAAIPYLAGTTAAAPVAIGLLGSGLTGVVALASQIKPLEKWYNGGLILMPGTSMSLQSQAASGALGALCEYIWEEIPI